VEKDRGTVLQPENHLRPEVQDALRALGYMDGGAGAGGDGDTMTSNENGGENNRP